MAPTFSLPSLVARQYGGYYNNNCYYNNCNSHWSRWGRWVLLVCIVVFAIFVALVLSCLNSRRRRRAGMQPRYGTGWLAGKTPDGHSGPSYTGYNNTAYNNNATAQAAPPYAPPTNQQYTGNTYNSNEGYYGQQSGIELQQPQTTYAPPRGDDQAYAAPQGPPPNKKHGDGVIR